MIIDPPTPVPPGGKITVTWNLVNATPNGHNHVQWSIKGSSATVKTLAHDLTSPYSSSFTAPSTPCTVCVQVNAILTDGTTKGEYSDTKEITVK